MFYQSACKEGAKGVWEGNLTQTPPMSKRRTLRRCCDMAIILNLEASNVDQIVTS